MSKCRRCKKEVSVHETMFGYCPKCIKELTREDKAVTPEQGKKNQID